MVERRRAARREPIEIQVEDGRVFTACPLPWMKSNELGAEILRQNTEGMNEFVQLYVTDAGVPQLEAKLKQKITDWHTPLRMAFPDEPEEKWTDPRVLDSDECAALLLTALDVNHLEQLRHLVDPNSPTPTLLGGIASLAPEGTETNGQKTGSTADSSEADSPETPSLSLVGEKSSNT